MLFHNQPLIKKTGKAEWIELDTESVRPVLVRRRP